MVLAAAHPILLVTGLLGAAGWGVLAIVCHRFGERLLTVAYLWFAVNAAVLAPTLGGYHLLPVWITQLALVGARPAQGIMAAGVVLLLLRTTGGRWPWVT